MSLKRILSVFIIGAGIAGGVWAQEAPGPALSLGQCLEIALSHNPLVLSSLERVEAARARASQASALPQPSLNLNFDTQPKLLGSSGESYVGLGQLVEFPGRKSLRRKIADRETAEIQADVDLLKLDIGFQVKQGFFGLLLAKEKLHYAQQDLDLSQDFLKKAEAKFASGEVAEVEVLRARVEAAKTAGAVRGAENDQRLAVAQLNFLMARKGYEPLEIQGEMKRPFANLDLEVLERRALSARPEIRALDASLDKEKLRKTQAYLSALPDFDLGLSRHRLAGEPTTWDLTISFPVPLFFWQIPKGPVAEAAANAEALRREADHLRNSIALEVREAYLNALSAREQIKLFEEQVLSQAEEVYNAFLFKFQEGEISGIELIDARRSLNEARREYADALYNYRLTIASLEKAIGLPLEGDAHDENE